MSPDDIKRGQWIMVTGLKNCDGSFPFEGVPMRVEAVSYPFVAARPIHGLIPAELKCPDVVRLNVGTFTFAKVNASYRRALGQKSAKPQPKSDDRPTECPTCGGKLRYRKSLEHVGQWTWVCGQCNTVVTPPVAGANV